MRRLDLVRGGPPVLNSLVLVAVLVPLAYIGYRTSFAYPGTLDDEGYFLVSLSQWFDGHSLYGEVYSQYGPGLFVLLGTPLGLLNLLDTDGARLVSLAIWLATSLLTGAVLLRICRNLPVAALGTGLAFFVLSSGLGQALHPGGLLCLLLIGTVAAAAFLLPDRPGAAMAAIGAMAAAAALMKVNVGGLMVIAVGYALVLTGERLGRAAATRLAACAFLALAPLALLSSDLSSDRGLRYAGTVAIGALALGLAATALPPSRWDLERRLGSLAAGFGGVAAVVLAGALITGSSPSDLARGVVLDPLRFTELVELPVGLDPAALPWGAVGLAGAALYRWRQAGGEQWSAGETMLIGIVSLAAGLAIWISLGAVPNVPGVSGSTTGMWLAAPIAWLAAVRAPGDGAGRDPFLSVLIPALAVTQLLHAYPVPGSQIGWSEFMLVPVGGVCIADGIERLAGTASDRRVAERMRVAGTVAVIALGAWFVLGPLRDLNRDVGAGFDGGEPLGLAGAERVRLDPARVTQYREVAADLENRCSNFISLPGLNSFYGWTRTEPPTSLNAGAWPWLLDTDRQERVVEAVHGNEGLCVLWSPFLYKTWSALLGPPPDRPLLRYVQDDFEVVRTYPYQYQPLQLLKRRGG